MLKSELLFRDEGIGDLVLINGVTIRVEWQIDRLRDGSLGDGCLHGDEHDLATAAATGSAKLLLTETTAAVIAIQRQDRGEAWFTTLSTASLVPTFRALTIASSDLTAERQIAIEFLGADGQRLLVTAPPEVIQENLPVLMDTVLSLSTGSMTASLTRFPKSWGTVAAETTEPLVLLRFNNDPLLAFDPEVARQIAASLIERAKEVETRSPTSH
jgi:hypothetical protein